MKIAAIGLLLVSVLRVGFLSAQTSGLTTATGAFVDVDGSRLYYEDVAAGRKLLSCFMTEPSIQRSGMTSGPPSASSSMQFVTTGADTAVRWLRRSLISKPTMLRHSFMIAKYPSCSRGQFTWRQHCSYLCAALSRASK